jgi:hypothetical protein
VIDRLLTALRLNNPFNPDRSGNLARFNAK